MLLLLSVSALSWAKTSLTIDTDNPGATINKNIYGQFMEHLGRGIYEGSWVGENSKIPNTNGMMISPFCKV